MRTLAGTLLVLAIFSPALVNAQTKSYDLGSTTVSCKDKYSTTVLIYEEFRLVSLSISWAKTTKKDKEYVPYIILNPSIKRKFPHEVQLFIFAHECAHHSLGHVLELFEKGYQKSYKEKEADCKAVKILMQKYGLSEEEIKKISDYFINTSKDLDSHLPGKQRAKRLLKCR